MLKVLIGNCLISQYQLGFKPEDSSIKQLLSATHDIYLNHLTLI